MRKVVLSLMYLTIITCAFAQSWSERKILFPHFGDIYTIASDGGNPVSIVRALYHDSYPEWKIVAGSAVPPPLWSPDGRYVLFVGWPKEPPDSVEDHIRWFAFGELFVLDLKKQVISQLTENTEREFHVSWSPDSSQIAFTQQDGESFDIYIARPDGSETILIKNIENSNSYQGDISWSPDAGQIAYTRMNTESAWDTYILNLQDLQSKKITNFDGWEWDPKWSPDGTTIAMRYGDDATPREGLFLIDSSGGNFRRLTPKRYQVIDFDWAPDGSKIVFACRQGVFIVKKDGSETIRLTNLINLWPYHSYRSPRWSPEGEYLTFIKTTGYSVMYHSNDIVVVRNDGSEKQQITEGVGVHLDW